MAGPTYQTAPFADVLVSGVKIGSCSNISWRENVQRRRIGVIGTPHAQDRPVTAIDVSVSIGFFQLVLVDLRQVGLIPGRGVEDFLQEVAAQIQCLRKPNGARIATIEDCYYVNGSWGMPANDVMSGSADYEGKLVKLASEK